MSMRIWLRARTQPLTRATTSIRVVTGRRMAKMVGLMSHTVCCHDKSKPRAFQAFRPGPLTGRELSGPIGCIGNKRM